MRNRWNARIERATELVPTYPYAAQVLRFYAQAARLQQQMYVEFEQAPTRFFHLDGVGWGQLNLEALQPDFGKFLVKIRQFAPATLAEAAQGLLDKGSRSWASLLESFWVSPTATSGEDQIVGTPGERCLAWLVLQPAAEYLSARKGGTLNGSTSSTCPLCGSKPVVAVLRQEGDGARKSLVCMLCGHEWGFRRVCCPACGEDREPQMAFYIAEEIPHVRVDVCNSCHSYLKSIDLTKSGLSVPVVDEMATLPLDLWARENGYQKLQINVAGI